MWLPSFSQLANTGLEFPHWLAAEPSASMLPACSVSRGVFPVSLPQSQEAQCHRGGETWGQLGVRPVSLRCWGALGSSFARNLLKCRAHVSCFGADVNSSPQGGSPPHVGPEMVHPARHHQRWEPRVLRENKPVCFPQVVLWFMGSDGPLRAALSCALAEGAQALNSETPHSRCSLSHPSIFSHLSQF